ncbi:hypothetical protein HY745_08165, partial [Candidatus Desantisbacteria bacterium]|nr:hypothetical protein [Candidatus Desantisbacteria bacterium]
GDYISANFSASADFKVGEAIRYLHNLDYTVRIKYKEFINRKEEERRIIFELQKKFLLLNTLNGYNYISAVEQDERARIHEFMERLVEDKGIRKDKVQQAELKPVAETKSIIRRSASNIDIIKEICKKLGQDGKDIQRKDVLAEAQRLGIKPSSVLLADYCDNTKTGNWSPHKFLHSVSPGRYRLK